MSGYYVVVIREPSKKWASAYGLFSSVATARDYMDNELATDQLNEIWIDEASDQEIDRVLEIRMRSNRSMVGTELVGIRQMK